jgi:hypothetical protein
VGRGKGALGTSDLKSAKAGGTKVLLRILVSPGFIELRRSELCDRLAKKAPGEWRTDLLSPRPPKEVAKVAWV